MKLKKFLALAICAFTLALASATPTKITKDVNATISTLRTTDSAYTTIQTITVTDTTVGVIEVTVVALADSLGVGVTGKQIVRFKKANGTLTLATPADVLAKVTDTALGTATWDISTSSNNIIIRVKGKLNYEIYWRASVVREYITNPAG